MTDPANRPPSVEVLLSHESLASLVGDLGRPVVAELVRAEIAALRHEIGTGERWPGACAIADRVKTRARRQQRQFPQRVINATGVLIHTNLGRAPYGPHLLTELTRRLAGYLSLEYDLDRGTRGKRGVATEQLLAELAGAEAALVVNNNAAAVYLALSALAWNRDVVISRGELVQIGGGFRIPEILAKSGAVLREVGTTNQTSLQDYERACDPNTALIMKVHRSNFVQTGFVAEVEPKDLAALGRKRGIPVLWDLGSGAVGPGAKCEYTGEPTLRAAIKTGVDLVTASGDKLLAGPQAGIILGKRELTQRLRSDPFYRAMRPDKATLVALEVAVSAHLARRAEQLLPVYRMAATPLDALRALARELAKIAAGAGWKADLVETADTFGGGSAPGMTMPGAGVRISGPLSATEIAARARAFDPPIIGIVTDDAFVLAVRTVSGQDQADLVRFLQAKP
ncbi:MAG: L-seryl-tRNA(Sec) selenium transferase [Candidatus Zixiibacteriota bacterium]